MNYFPDIKSMSLQELKEKILELGLPAFRAGQIYRWLSKGADFSEMTDISQQQRELLQRTFTLELPAVERKQISKTDGTIKYLWRLADGNCVESVLMSYKHGNTVCVSSQVGCRMGCAFCASTKAGLVRCLTPGEILDQVIFAQKDSGMHISNIVLMGIGEPLDNFDNVMHFLELVNSKEGLNIGMRHISLSTCGLVPGIDKLAEYNIQLTLSISLHCAENTQRSEIMPVNRSFNVDSLLQACERYFNKTGRRISFEYAMIADVNDTEYHAKLLAAKLKGTQSHVNLIPLNEIEESPFKPSSPKRVAAFKKILEDSGLAVTVRRKLGGDIDASCGQLRRKAQCEKEKDVNAF